MHDGVNERIRGGLLAHAAGDALGAPAENMSRDEIRRVHGRLDNMVGDDQRGLAPGKWTDDTAMMLAVAEGLVEAPGDPREAVGRRFVQWFETEPKDVGNIVRVALTAFKASGDWDAATARTRQKLREMTAGNGSLMRTLPVSFAFTGDREMTMRFSAKLSTMTHPHELATVSCVFFNELVRLLALGEDKEGSLGGARELIEGEEALVSSISKSTFFEHVGRMKTASYTQLRATGYVLDSLVSSLWCFWNTDGLEEAVVAAVGIGGDVDTVGALTGGLAGTFYGFGAIPARWLEPLFERERIEEAARGLAGLASAHTQDPGQ